VERWGDAVSTSPPSHNPRHSSRRFDNEVDAAIDVLDDVMQLVIERGGKKTTRKLVPRIKGLQETIRCGNLYKLRLSSEAATSKDDRNMLKWVGRILGVEELADEDEGKSAACHALTDRTSTVHQTVRTPS